MKSSLIALAICGAILASTGAMFMLALNNDVYDNIDTNMGNLFVAWKIQYGRNYPNFEEESFRLKNFQKNFLKVQNHAADVKNTFTMKLNQFADLSEEEINQKFVKFSFPDITISDSFDTKNAYSDPESADWTQQSGSIRDKGQCGDSWSIPTIASLQALQTLENGQFKSLSLAQLIECVSESPCQGSMVSLTDMFEYVKNNGMESEQDYPWTGKWGKCKYNSDKVSFRIIDYTSIPKGNSDALRHALSTQPIPVGINASSLSFYSGGIFNDWSCDPKNINTGMTLVGYGVSNGTKYWKVMAGWGADFGENGFVRMERKDGADIGICGITEMAVYATV